MAKEARGGDAFTLASFGWRLLFTLTLVLATFNPTAFSYFHWLRAAFAASALGPAHLVAGVALLGGWLIVVSATQRALGSVGLAVLAAFIGAIVWWLIDAGLLTTASFTAILWTALVSLAIVLAIGMSWSYLWRRLTGQVAVDRVDD